VNLRDLFSRERPIGIDITNEAIVLVEMSKKKGELELVNLGMAPTPIGAVRDGEIVDPSQVAATIQEIMAVEGFKCRKAITSVSGQAAIIRTIKFPAMTPKELKEVVLAEAERYIPFAVSDVNLDFQALDTVEEDGGLKTEVLLVAAQKQLINSYVEAVTVAGLELVAVDVASFAVSRSLGPSMDGPEPVVLVLIRGETTDINVMKEGVPRFSRSIPIGSATFAQVIASGLNVSLEEAIAIHDRLVLPVAGAEPSSDPLVEQAATEIRSTLRELTTEIQRSLEYFHQSQGVEKIGHAILSGRGAKMKHLDKHLATYLGLNVEIGNPVGFTFDETRYPADFLVEQAPILATAIGLARRGVEGA
jgi:type IV pilus assembly protein PilM